MSGLVHVIVEAATVRVRVVRVGLKGCANMHCIVDAAV